MLVLIRLLAPKSLVIRVFNSSTGYDLRQHCLRLFLVTTREYYRLRHSTELSIAATQSFVHYTGRAPTQHPLTLAFTNGYLYIAVERTVYSSKLSIPNKDHLSFSIDVAFAAFHTSSQSSEVLFIKFSSYNVVEYVLVYPTYYFNLVKLFLSFFLTTFNSPSRCISIFVFKSQHWRNCF